jgi:hypothetical protein
MMDIVIVIVIGLVLCVAMVALVRKIKREMAIRKAFHAIKKIREYRNRTSDIPQGCVIYGVKNSKYF